MNNPLPDTIAVGDKVVLRDERSNESVRVVSRLTKSWVCIEGASPGSERNFWRKNGDEVGTRGNMWRWSTIEPATPEKLAALEDKAQRADAIHFLHSFNPQGIATAVLQDIAAIVRNAKRQS